MLTKLTVSNHPVALVSVVLVVWRVLLVVVRRREKGAAMKKVVVRRADSAIQSAARLLSCAGTVARLATKRTIAAIRSRRYLRPSIGIW